VSVLHIAAISGSELICMILEVFEREVIEGEDVSYNNEDAPRRNRPELHEPGSTWT
jgi:hypothetical protein